MVYIGSNHYRSLVLNGSPFSLACFKVVLAASCNRWLYNFNRGVFIANTCLIFLISFRCSKSKAHIVSHKNCPYQSYGFLMLCSFLMDIFYKDHRVPSIFPVELVPKCRGNHRQAFGWKTRHFLTQRERLGSFFQGKNGEDPRINL